MKLSYKIPQQSRVKIKKIQKKKIQKLLHIKIHEVLQPHRCMGRPFWILMEVSRYGYLPDKWLNHNYSSLITEPKKEPLKKVILKKTAG